MATRLPARAGAAAVEWSSQASSDIEDIGRYIAAENPKAAGAVFGRLLTAADDLALHPLRGREVPEFEQSTLREVISGSYRVVYRVETGRVVILTVFHARRLFGTVLGEP